MSDKPFIPNSYITPNAYCDRLMYLLTPTEWKVLSYAVRRIFGFQKRHDNISLSQFVHGTVSTKDGEALDHGTGLSRPTVIACLDSLIQYRLITRLADNDPIKNEGDLYSLQLDYDQVDYTGLIDRANGRSSSDQQRTTTGRNAAAQKRQFQQIPLPGQSDLPEGVVNGIDRGWSMGLTGGGQSGRPGVVNGIDTQKTVGKTEETQREGLSLPDFDKACVILKDSSPIDYAEARPILIESSEKPYRLLIKLDSVPTGFMDAFKAAIYRANPRRHYRLSFDTPALNNSDRDNARDKPAEADESVNDSILEIWHAIVSELGFDMQPRTFQYYVEPAKLVSVNGSWTVAVPAVEWWQNRLSPSLKRIYKKLTGKTTEFNFVEMR